MRRILVVEDDVGLARLLEEYLVPEGFAVTLLHDGADPRAVAPDGHDLVVLDVMLPNRSGFEVLREIRRRSDLPVILLTARDNETDRVVGLELGADDYVPKPFNPRELVARIRAVLRRTQRGVLAELMQPADPVLRVGDVMLDPQARAATRAGQPLDLTSAEFDLLERMLLRAGQAVSRDELAQAALGRTALGRTALGRTASRSAALSLDRNVDTLVSKLRRKLGSDELIKTVRNVGYLYATPQAPPG